MTPRTFATLGIALAGCAARSGYVPEAEREAAEQSMQYRIDVRAAATTTDDMTDRDRDDWLPRPGAGRMFGTYVTTVWAEMRNVSPTDEMVDVDCVLFDRTPDRPVYERELVFVLQPWQIRTEPFAMVVDRLGLFAWCGLADAGREPVDGD